MQPDEEWDRVLADLRNFDDIDRACRAIEALDRISDRSRVPALYALLDDPEFFVREAAATPLARIEGLSALPALYRAVAKGQQDGDDNDGLNATIWELLELNPPEAVAALLRLIESPDIVLRSNAAWGLGFVAAATRPDRLIELVVNDPIAAVRAAAVVSLGAFKGDPRAREALTRATADVDPEVRRAATHALKELGA